MAKDDKFDGGKFEKGGYRPLNEGYTPKEQRGYVPTSQGGGLPTPPIGGTGESPLPSTPSPAKGKQE